MRDKHIFSKSYIERKDAVLHALRREEAAEKSKQTRGIPHIPVKILVSALILSALTVSVYATVQWTNFRMEQNGDEIRIHASLPDTSEEPADTAEKPLRSWNAEEGEISIRLNIPDLPSDMKERDNTNGKYYSEDTSRSMTINGIDLRRSDLEEILGGADDAKQIDAGGKEMYVVTWDNEASFYNRMAYIVFEEEELVLKLWVSYGITDDELLTMASTLTIEETDDALLALPIVNEVADDSYDWTTPYYSERDPIYETDLLEIGESKRAKTDWYTATVNGVEVFDNVNVLNPSYIFRKDFVERFTDDAGNLIPYTRTEILFTQEGSYMSKQFGESVLSSKKLYVITLTMADVNLDDLDEEDRDDMLKACVNGFHLTNYTVSDGEIELLSSGNVVVDKRPEVHADTEESIYREYLGNNRWKIAFLVDETIADGDLMLQTYTGKIYVKIQ